MDLSKLPDDIIRYIEKFVDKSPPYAKELLEFKNKIKLGHKGLPWFLIVEQDYMLNFKLIRRYNKQTHYNKLISYNTRKTLNQLSKERFGKCISKLDSLEIYILHSWYLLHYD